VKRFRHPGSDEIRATARRNCFQRAPKELTRRNQQFRNDTILALPQQTPETGREHDRSIDSRNIFCEQGDYDA
jgi:hypothetical protein